MTYPLCHQHHGCLSKIFASLFWAEVPVKREWMLYKCLKPFKSALIFIICAKCGSNPSLVVLNLFHKSECTYQYYICHVFRNDFSFHSSFSAFGPMINWPKWVIDGQLDPVMWPRDHVPLEMMFIYPFKL